ADRVIKADPHPSPYGGPDIARLRRRDRLPDNRTLANPDGRWGGLSRLNSLDDPLLLPAEAHRLGAEARTGRKAGNRSTASPHHSPYRRNEPIAHRMAALKAQLCSRVSLKRSEGHSSIVVRKSQALRARKTGIPSWSSALADGFLMRKRSISE